VWCGLVGFFWLCFVGFVGCVPWVCFGWVFGVWVFCVGVWLGGQIRVKWVMVLLWLFLFGNAGVLVFGMGGGGLENRGVEFRYAGWAGELEVRMGAWCGSLELGVVFYGWGLWSGCCFTVVE